jgi:hypothetical protein
MGQTGEARCDLGWVEAEPQESASSTDHYLGLPYARGLGYWKALTRGSRDTAGFALALEPASYPRGSRHGYVVGVHLGEARN